MVVAGAANVLVDQRRRFDGAGGSARAAKLYPLPKERRHANLNTASLDRQGVLWFTGQNGIYGRLDPKTGGMAVFDAPRGTGPYGITTTPHGQVFFASLAGNYLGQIDPEADTVTVLEPPVPRQGARPSRSAPASCSTETGPSPFVQNMIATISERSTCTRLSARPRAAPIISCSRVAV